MAFRPTLTIPTDGPALRAAAMPNAGQTAARLVEAVAADSSELIDPERVTEVPWELQPGREPMD